MCNSKKHSTKTHKARLTRGRLNSNKWWGCLSSKNKKDALRKTWADPEYYARMCKVRKKQAVEHKESYSKAMLEKWTNPEFYTKMCKIRKTQSKGNMMRQPNASFYRTMYKGKNGKFWMRSSWEVCFALWLDHCGIKWEYEKKKFLLSKGHYYTPDFYLPDQDEYVELKGWMTKKDEKKLAKFAKKYPNVKLYVFGSKHLVKVLEFKKKIA